MDEKNDKEKEKMKKVDRKMFNWPDRLIFKMKVKNVKQLNFISAERVVATHMDKWIIVSLRANGGFCSKLGGNSKF